MSDAESQPIDLERTFSLMDVADELRRQRRRVEEHLEISDRDSIKSHLIERYRAMGHDADPQLIDEAIDRVLEQAYRFRPPEPGLGLRLGRLWARRRQIGRRLTLPLVALVALGGVGTTIVTSLNSLWYGRQERAVESLVGDLAVEAQRVRSRFSELERALPATDLEPRAVAELRGRLERSGVALATVDGFLDQYAPGGDPQEGVTSSNHDDAEARLPEVRAALGDAGDALSEGAAIIDRVDLGARAASLAAAAEAVAVEPAARARTLELSARVEREMNAGDPARLRDTVGELETLLDTLEQEYTLRGVAGVERDETRYYVIVQAVAGDGSLLSVRIRNEEDGRIRTVEEWAERVPREVYDAVGRDYENDGVIDDDVFGQKIRGYLEAERRFGNLGQITDW